MDEKGLGQRLQEARRAAGLTQQALCQQANISYSTLAKIERGAIKAPSIFTIQNLAGAMDLTLDGLLGSPKKTDDGKQPGLRSKNGIRFVYFDVNGCLVHYVQRAFVCLARETGISAEAIENFSWHYNDAVCRGDMSMDEYNTKLAECLRVSTVDWKDYYLGAVQSVPGMDALVAWTGAHYKIGLLTNIMPGCLDGLRERGRIPEIAYDVIIDSSEVGAIKPEPRIFEIAAERAGVKPSEILLIDDDKSNIAAAEKQGWHVLLCDDYQPEETALRVRQALELIG